MAGPIGYIAATVPATTLRVSQTTLFHVAALVTGDPLQWVTLAEINGTIDPWVTPVTELLIPPVFPTGVQDGILGI